MTTDMGQGGLQEEVSGLGDHVKFAMGMSGKSHDRHQASAPFCNSHRANLGHIWVCPLRAPSGVPAESSTSPRAVSLGVAWDLCPSTRNTRNVLGLREWEVSQPMVRGCHSQSCLHMCPHPAGGDPDVSLSPGRPSRSHSTMSLSVRPQRRVLVTKINRSQSFAGVNSSADRPFR